MNREKTLDMIRAKEGLRLKAYKCPAGRWTIGYGYNLEAVGYKPAEASTMVWTEDEAERALEAHFNRCLNQVTLALPWVTKLDDARQAVVVIMAYALGMSGLLQWRPTLEHIKAGEYSHAAGHLLSSLWQRQLKGWQRDKTQPTRLDEMAEMLRSGRWPG